MKFKYKIMVVQTDQQKLEDLIGILESSFASVVAAPAKRASATLQNFGPDLIITYYSTADMAGILFFKKLAALADVSLVPTIFIADSQVYDHRLNAYELGAVDFIQRPLDKDKISKKCLGHILQGRAVRPGDKITVGNLTVDLNSKEVRVQNLVISLTTLEYKVLHCLLTSPRPIVTRSEIYQAVWKQDLSSTGRLDTQLYNLKKKLINFDGKIKSVNKVGMRILTNESIFVQELTKLEPPPPSRAPRL
jgi:DNA-binding response OmpR family regulator